MLGAAVAAPLVVCALLARFRDDVSTANAVLVLVVVVVGAAATGRRLAGVVAALSSGLWFDVLLTEPYGRLAIDDRADIETAVLLLVVGVAVSEIASWGRRQQAQTSRMDGYLAGIVSAASLVATGSAPSSAVVEHVRRQITDVLGVDGCRFDTGTGGAHPRLDDDGTVTLRGLAIDVDRDGLPTDDVIELPVRADGVVLGRFLLTSSTQVHRPTLDQRLVAVTLAQQVGPALGGRHG